MKYILLYFRKTSIIYVRVDSKFAIEKIKMFKMKSSLGKSSQLLRRITFLAQTIFLLTNKLTSYQVSVYDNR